MANDAHPSVNSSERMERILDAFEEAWRRGERPELEKYLATQGVPRRPLLVELVHTDLHYRLKNGDTVRVEDYLRRYPELVNDADAVVDLAAVEWELRKQRTPALQEEFLRRFAAHRDKLRARLAVVALVEDVNNQSVGGARPLTNSHKPREGQVSNLPVLSSGSKPAPSARQPEAPRQRGRLLRMGGLLLLGLVMLLGYAVLYLAYRGAESRRQDLEHGERDRQAAQQKIQHDLDETQRTLERTEAAGQQERKQRLHAEADLERIRLALYANRLTNAQLLQRDGDLAQAVTVLERCAPDLRHWEWRYLRRLCSPRLAGAMTLGPYFSDEQADGPARPLSIVAALFSADGKYLVSLAQDEKQTRSELRLWQTATGRPLRTYPCPDLLCTDPCLSDDGKVLAVRVRRKSADPTEVRLWATESGKSLPTIRKEGHDIAALAFAPDGSWLVTRGKEGTARVWNTMTGEERCFCAGAAAINSDVAISPDGKHIVSVGGAALVIDPADGKVIRTLPVGDFEARSVAFSSDGRWLALSGMQHGRKVVQLRRSLNDRELLSLHDLGGKLFFSRDGRYLAAVEADQARLWDSQTGRTRTVAGLGQGGLHPDGRRALLQQDGRFEMWDIQERAPSRLVADGAILPGPGTPSIIPLANSYGPPVLSADGRRLAAAYLDGQVRVWDLAATQELRAVEAPLSLSLALNHDGTQLATAGRKPGTLVVWNVDSGTERCTLTCPGRVNRLTFSSKGRLLAVSTTPEREGHAELSVWETATGARRCTLAGATAHDFLNVAISADEKTVFDFTPGQQAEARAWNLETASQQAKKTLYSSAFLPVFSPDGKHLACYAPTGSQRQGEVCLLDAAGGAVLWSRSPGSAAVSALAFSADGRRLAAACARGGRVRIWDTATGQELLTLAAHAQFADAVRFDADDQSLLTLGFESQTARSYAVKRWQGPRRP